MSEPASISATIGGRYATAIFELAREGDAIPALEADVAALRDALGASPELRGLIASPVHSRAEQGAAIGAVATRMGLSAPMGNGLQLMASRRRLFTLPQLLDALSDLIADAKGELTAQVVSACKLSPAQAKSLAATLTQQTGKTVKLNAAVDEGLIGGMIVKLGSRMVDTSIRSKLASLKNTMQEVG